MPVATRAPPAATAPGTTPAWATAHPAIRATSAPTAPASRQRIFHSRGEGDSQGVVGRSLMRPP